ncbi:MAG: hypothetical protein ABIP51_09835 [Bacteroidia bacterium]
MKSKKITRPKKPTKKAIVIKTDKSFDELIEEAFNDKVFKKDKVVHERNAKPQERTPKPNKKG